MRGIEEGNSGKVGRTPQFFVKRRHEDIILPIHLSFVFDHGMLAAIYWIRNLISFSDINLHSISKRFHKHVSSGIHVCFGLNVVANILVK